jgi:hypothetical protein
VSLPFHSPVLELFEKRFEEKKPLKNIQIEIDRKFIQLSVTMSHPYFNLQREAKNNH